MQADTNLKTQIGRRLAAARALRSLRQIDMAEALGVNKFTVSKWERGLQLPDADTIYRICKLLDISADFLLGLNETVRHEV